MAAANCVSRKQKLRKWSALPLGLGMLALFAAIASAASYMRTTLKDLTTRSVAVAEVQVVDKKYPALEEGQTFPRTHIEMKLLKSLKGALPEQFVLDTPGGINGNVVSYVPDGPDFKLGERAIVFIKEPRKGHYMVQDLGLGKFNVVQRDNKDYVESALCARALAGKVETQEDLEASLLTKSIPYDTFCNMVSAYVAGGTPDKDPAALAAMLAPSTSHNDSRIPSAVADVSQAQQVAKFRQTLLYSAFVLVLFAVIAALVVQRRRQMKTARVSARHIAMLMGGALVAGAALGGVTSHAFVQFDQKTSWNLDKALTGKVADSKIIWRQSTSVSKTNANCFTSVQQAFDQWQAVDLSRLAFTLGGTTANATNNSGDGENVMAWSETPSDDFSDRTLAICFSSFTVGTTSSFQDGDIIFNDRDFNWAPGNSGNVLSVALHEIGHFIGLNHSTDNKTVMFPFDSGFTTLSTDEIAAAQAIYPGPAENPTNPTPPPAGPVGVPVAVAEGSPTSGLPPLEVSFSALNSEVGPSGSPIVSYEWNFGDSTSGTGEEVTHVYTSVGTFTASLRVTDADGASGMATIEINVGKNAQVTKGAFKVNFKSIGKDSFSVTFFSDKLIGIKSLPTTGEPILGSVLIGDQEWLFDFDVFKAKSVNKLGPKIKVNDKSGIATVSIKNADLQDVLGGHGAENDNIFGEIIDVPVTLWFGEGSGIYIFGEVPFFYKASADKGGSGKF